MHDPYYPVYSCNEPPHAFASAQLAVVPTGVYNYTIQRGRPDTRAGRACTTHSAEARCSIACPLYYTTFVLRCACSSSMQDESRPLLPGVRALCVPTQRWFGGVDARNATQRDATHGTAPLSLATPSCGSAVQAAARAWRPGAHCWARAAALQHAPPRIHQERVYAAGGPHVLRLEGAHGRSPAIIAAAAGRLSAH